MVRVKLVLGIIMILCGVSMMILSNANIWLQSFGLASSVFGGFLIGRTKGLLP